MAKLLFPARQDYNGIIYEAGNVYEITNDETPGYIERWIKRGAVYADDDAVASDNVVAAAAEVVAAAAEVKEAEAEVAAAEVEEAEAEVIAPDAPVGKLSMVPVGGPHVNVVDEAGNVIKAKLTKRAAAAFIEKQG
jgi:hypothetical protein